MIPLEVVALSPLAAEWVARRGRSRIGQHLRDRFGRAIEIGEWHPDDWDALLAMYRSFDPAQRTLGLPPLGEERQAVWVDELWRRGLNVVARSGRRVVGHAALVPGEDRAALHEFVVFVHQEYQSAGIGGALVEELLTLARRRGLEPAWLGAGRRHAGRRVSPVGARLARGLRRAARAWRRVEAAAGG